MLKCITQRFSLVFAVFPALFLGACASTVQPSEPSLPKVSQQGKTPPSGWEWAPQGGGYYQDDGPGEFRPIDLVKLPDASPQLEPIQLAKTKPYETMGQTFVPQTTLEEPYRAKGHASWYGKKFHGTKTATGEIYDMYQMTAAHPTLPLPCYVRVTNLSNNRSVVVRVNDRGPFLRNRLIDLSYAAALKLDLIGHGSAQVLVEKITPEKMAEFQSGRVQNVAQATADQGTVQSRPLVSNPAGKRGSLYLQIGAFGSRASAETLLGKVSNSSQDLGKSGQILSESGLHRVLLGPFGSLDQANQAAGQVEQWIAVRPLIKQDLILP
jgi:rare lipoprotein A